jgi:beta-galactosidase
MTEFRDGVGGAGPAVLRRRQFLWAAAAGAAGWLVTACWPRPVRSPRRPGPRLIPFGTGWLFGPAAADSSQPGFGDSGLQAVTLPHTVTRLSWREWNPASWERVWVYRKHFDAPWPTGHAVHAQ